MNSSRLPAKSLAKKRVGYSTPCSKSAIHSLFPIGTGDPSGTDNYGSFESVEANSKYGTTTEQGRKTVPEVTSPTLAPESSFPGSSHAIALASLPFLECSHILLCRVKRASGEASLKQGCLDESGGGLGWSGTPSNATWICMSKRWKSAVKGAVPYI